MAALTAQGVSEEDFLAANPGIKRGHKIPPGTKVNLPKGVDPVTMKTSLGVPELNAAAAPASAPEGTLSVTTAELLRASRTTVAG